MVTPFSILYYKITFDADQRVVILKFSIPIYRPNLTQLETTYVNECLESTWISSQGAFIDRFEKGFSELVGVGHAATCTNGTVALHLALLALHVQPGDEVIVPTLTYVASVNAIQYCGAKPVFIDSNPDNWQMDISKLEQLITPKTKAVMAVHLYGWPTRVDLIREICDRKGIYLIEDCAEAIGSKINGQTVGSFGHVSTFSFFGNKTITTGEGGMVCSNDKSLIDHVTLLKMQGVDPNKKYWHPVVGYNYRMTNIAAAIGCAQLERIEGILARKKEIAKFYTKRLNAKYVNHFNDQESEVEHTYWMNSILCNEGQDRYSVMAALQKVGIDTRPLFYPVHTMPMYAKGETFPCAEKIASQGINLPSFPDITEEELTHICDQLLLL